MPAVLDIYTTPVADKLSPCSKSKAEIRFQLKTNRFAMAGLLLHDVIVVTPNHPLRTGLFVVLDFGDKLVIRKIECHPQFYLLESPDHLVQAIEWPIYHQLPIKGVVSRIERRMT